MNNIIYKLSIFSMELFFLIKFFSLSKNLFISVFQCSVFITKKLDIMAGYSNIIFDTLFVQLI